MYIILICDSVHIIWTISYGPYGLCFSCPFQAHPKIRELFDEADFERAVLEIMTGTKCGLVGDFPVVEKLREQLERSSTEIFPFFGTCSRKVHKTLPIRHVHKL